MTNRPKAISKAILGIIAFSLLALLAPLGNAAEDASNLLAKPVLGKADIRATVCEMPRVGDGTLAVRRTACR